MLGATSTTVPLLMLFDEMFKFKLGYKVMKSHIFSVIQFHLHYNI